MYVKIVFFSLLFPLNNLTPNFIILKITVIRAKPSIFNIHPPLIYNSHILYISDSLLILVFVQ